MKYIERKSYKGGTDIVICETEVQNKCARLAEELMRHLAIVAAVPDGEDSSGQQKMRMMTEQEVVTRATRIAELAWSDFRERQWILDIPLPKAPASEVI